MIQLFNHIKRKVFTIELLIPRLIILFTLILSAPRAGIAQETNWDNKLNSILNSGIHDSLIAQQLGDVAYELTIQRKLTDADKFIASQKKVALQSGNKSQIAYSIYTSTVRFYNLSSSDTLLQKLQYALTLSDQGSNLLIRIKIYRLLAQFYESNSRIEEAKNIINSALKYAEIYKDKNEIAKVNLIFGIVLNRLDDHKGALDKYYSAIEYLEKSNEYRSLAVAYNSVGNILFKIKDYEKAKLYYNKNLIHCQKNYSPYLPTAYLGLATLHYTHQNLDSALWYYDKSDSVMQIYSDHTRLHVVYTNKATIYQQLNEMDSADVYHRKTIALAEKMKKIGHLGILYANYSSFLLKKSEMDSAMKAINKALELSAEEKDEVGIAIELKQKAEIYFAMGNFNEAANYYNLTINYKDSIAIEEKKRETSRLIEEYESAKKQNEISTLQNEKRIQQLEIEKQQAIIRGNLESYRQKQSEIDLLNKENIISSLNLQNKKDELNRKTIEAASKELALNLSTQREKLKEREIINQKNTKNIIIYGSLLTLFLLGILFNQYRQSQRRKAEAETRDLQHQLSEMKIEALRAQMNPHFIFNALNSVNRYIIRSDVETASEYLVKFSKLMRLVLENSKSSLVSLHNEIEALRLYIELEQLRFDNKFSFTININESIDKDTTSIPPLILQPYVENAIWHGLMNKSSSGKVDITINKIGHNQLKCIIQDDGIGRKKANQFKSETLGSQRSFGTEITKERIKLLNGSDQNFKIIDLIDENSQPLGTRIEIILNTFSIK